MNDPTKQDSAEANDQEMKAEETTPNFGEQDDDAQAVFVEFCEELEGIIPTEIFEMIKQVRPIKAANMLLWQFGGSIRTNNPEIDLKSDYVYPEEVNELNDVVGDFSFIVAPSPFFVLASAVTAHINANEEIIQACDLENYVPIIIEEGDDVKRIGLIDFENRRLELTMNSPVNISIDMTGDTNEQEEAMAEGLSKFADYLDVLKQQMEEPPSLFASSEEEEALKAWCEKHSYSVAGIFRASVDNYF